MILRHQVTREEEGTALLLILRRSMGLSAAAVKALKAHDGLEVDGVLRFTTYVVTAGEIVTADVTRAEGESDNLPEDGPLKILFEDAGLIAVDKPPGCIVHPSHSRNTETLANFVAGYLQKSGARPICHIVNRLDRDTSGVVLFAKNAHVKARATVALHSGIKRYTAVIWGEMTPAHGVIDLPIRRLQPRDMLRIVAQDGKPAVTRYRTVGQGVFGTDGEAGEHSSPLQRYSVLEMTLETGRTHQIRVHCLARGAPLVGDPLYHTAESRAKNQALGVSRQLLHSHYLAFPHPMTGDWVEITSPAVFPEVALEVF